MPDNRTPLSRFGFSFLIVGFFLAYEGYESALGLRGPVTTGRIILYLVGAVLCFVLGFTGIRQRHRR